MTEKELKKLFDKELANNPSLYEKAVMPSLIESKISHADILTKYMEAVKIKISKTQRRWMDEADGITWKGIAIENKTRGRIDAWKASGKTVYTLDDFPEWVIENLKRKFNSANKAVYDVAIETITSKPEEFGNFNQKTPEEFAVANGKAYFTKDGYIYLVQMSVFYNWVNGAEHQRWVKEKPDIFEISNFGSSPAK